MRATIRTQWPWIWQKLESMVEGLQAPVSEVSTWNCRGNLVHSTPDGCTTPAGISAEGKLVIAHNEDGFLQLRGDYAVVHVTSDVGLTFTSFAYPGSLCGYTFAVNEKGIVNTINNIRAVHRPEGVPCQILARTLLDATTLGEAITLLTTTPRTDAFHHMLGRMGDSYLFSMEAIGSDSSMHELTTAFGHANYLIYPQLTTVERITTGSSGSRQQRLDAWLATTPSPDGVTVKTMLSNQHDPLLSVYRLSAGDPDDENTLVTIILILSATRVA